MLRSFFTNAVQLNGRMSRGDYWICALAAFAGYLLAGALDLVLFFGTLTSLYTFALLVPMFSATVRRAHDSGRTAASAVIVLATIIITPPVVFLGLLALAAVAFSGTSGDIPTWAVITGGVGIGLFVLAGVLTLTGVIVWLRVACLSGDVNPNKYGPPPHTLSVPGVGYSQTGEGTPNSPDDGPPAIFEPPAYPAPSTDPGPPDRNSDHPLD